jgi:hypothetical protein
MSHAFVRAREPTTNGEIMGVFSDCAPAWGGGGGKSSKSGGSKKSNKSKSRKSGKSRKSCK